MASKFIGVARGMIRQSTRHRPETTDAEMVDAAADGVKKRARFPSSEGGVKERSGEGEYNHFAILPFFREDISARVFHHFTI